MPHDPFFISKPTILASLSHSVFERRTTSGCGLFAFLGGGFVQMFEQIVSITVNAFSNTNVAVSKKIKRENLPLPVAAHRSKTPLL